MKIDQHQVGLQAVMFTEDKLMKKHQFPLSIIDTDYKVFPNELEDDQGILFHGTKATNFKSILQDGFRSAADLNSDLDNSDNLGSVSYAKQSTGSLHAICTNPDYGKTGFKFVIFAVKFETLNSPKIRINPSDIHVFDKEIQPKIIGYCCIPTDYVHK